MNISLGNQFDKVSKVWHYWHWAKIKQLQDFVQPTPEENCDFYEEDIFAALSIDPLKDLADLSLMVKNSLDNSIPLEFENLRIQPSSSLDSDILDQFIITTEIIPSTNTREESTQGH